MNPFFRSSGQDATPPAERLIRHPCGRRPSVCRWWGGIPPALLLVVTVCALLACGSSGPDSIPEASAEGATATLLAAQTGPTSTQIPASVGPYRIPPTATPPAPLAALVNGEYIFLADLDRLMLLYEQALLAEGFDVDSEEGRAHLGDVQHDVLESLIDYALIRQEAAALGIELSDAEIEAQLESDVAAGGGQMAFEEWLQMTGQTREDYKEMLRRSMLSQRVLEVVTADAPLAVEQVHARHILVDTEDQARQILAALRQGAGFEELAREHSLDFATSMSGGDLGWFPRGLVAPELETAVFALHVGETSDVVRVGEGYHIVQLLERQSDRPLPEDMQVDYRFALFDQWLAERREAATIERLVGP